MALLGVINISLPFTLISWSEMHITSGLAGLLNGTVPLFTIVIAHVFVSDDRITLAKLTGLLVGFGGVALLVSRDIGPQGLSGGVWGQIAVVAASALYACSSVLIRIHLRGLHPIVIAAISTSTALVVMWIAAPIAEAPFALPRLPLTWLAVAWLGIIGTTTAYLGFFYLINTWGPTRSTTVTYVIPVVAVVLGVIFLGERLDWKIVAGGLAVIGGVLIVNWRTLLPALLRASTST